MIELIRNKDNWCSIVESAVYSDFYHTYDYHHLSRREDESPVLVHYKEGKIRIALPLLFRVIPGTNLMDATSVYGYSGPLGISLSGTFDNSRFRNELVEFLKWNGVTSAFSRLNPFIPYQKDILDGLGEIYAPGKIIHIDLTKGIERNWHEYNRRLRTYINKCRGVYDVVKATTKDQVKSFIELYYSNMRRVGAHEGYFFDEAYFFDLLQSRDFNTEILLAKNKSNDEIVGGAMLIKKDEIFHVHLSGVKAGGLHLNPIKLLLDEIRQLSSLEGYKYFNLGGGVSNHQDSLFRFKSSYSKDFLDFNLWKFIIDREAYIDLVRTYKSGICNKAFIECKDFFPCYRCELVKV